MLYQPLSAKGRKPQCERSEPTVEGLRISGATKQTNERTNEWNHTQVPKLQNNRLAPGAWAGAAPERSQRGAATQAPGTLGPSPAPLTLHPERGWRRQSLVGPGPKRDETVVPAFCFPEAASGSWTNAGGPWLESVRIRPPYCIPVALATAIPAPPRGGKGGTGPETAAHTCAKENSACLFTHAQWDQPPQFGR